MFHRYFIQTLALLLGLISGLHASPLLKDAERIQAKVERIRGQRISGKLKMGIMSKDRILAFLEKRIAEEYSPEEFQRTEIQLKLLGLIPPSYDYRSELKQIYVDQIGGFYDHTQQELYIADWLPSFSQEPVLAHEIFHGIQVQEWGTAPLLDSKTVPTDQLLAHQALLEGDATIVMLQFMLEGLGQDESNLGVLLNQSTGTMLKQLSMSPKLSAFVGGSENFARAPRYVKRSLVMPYILGAQFIWHLKTKGVMSWSQINEIYKNPPRSMQQIIHPDTFLSGTYEVVSPPLPAKKPATWTLTETDTLGVFLMSEALERDKPHDAEPLDLKGWRGDALRLYQKGVKSALLITSIWATTADASAFAKLWRERYPQNEDCMVIEQDSSVQVLLSTSKADSENLAQELGIR